MLRRLHKLQEPPLAFRFRWCL